jgi:RHS repeat-associated protein
VANLWQTPTRVDARASWSGGSFDDGQDSTTGTVTDDGTYEPAPVVDEFGRIVGHGDANLDWLGAERRHRTGDYFGLVRMGVRLYDPGLGRFLGVDPIDGGSANTYDYCNADPINCRDLTGEFSFSWASVAIWALVTGAIVGCGALAAGTAGLAAGACVAGAAPVLAMAGITAHSIERGGEMSRTVVVSGLSETAMGVVGAGVTSTIKTGAAAAWGAGGSLAALTGLVAATSPGAGAGQESRRKWSSPAPAYRAGGSGLRYR